jgi:hypothetical protein
MLTTPVAKRLYHAYLSTFTATRPIDIKVASANFEGHVQMAHAFGIGNTPFHVKITVMETILPTYCGRPDYGTVNNKPQQDFDAEAVNRLMVALDAIDFSQES